MTEEMTFNGVGMSRFFRVQEVVRAIGNDRNISQVDAPLIGTNIQKVSFGAKKITVNFTMLENTAAEIEALKHELAGVLHVKEPARLTFEDEPDKYYMAIPTGDVSIGNINRVCQKGEITFLVPDGVAHSVTYKRVVDYEERQGKMVFTIDNKGTADAYPIITFKANEENGYYGLVSDRFAFEVGNIEEVDGKIVSKSELLYDFRGDKIRQAFISGQKNVGITNVPEAGNGTLELEALWNRHHIKLQTNRVAPARSASITWPVPPDSSGNTGALTEYLWWRQIFWAGHSSQYGFIKVTVTDENDKFLYGVETYKRSLGLATEYNFLGADEHGGYNVLKSWTFNATHLNEHNPFNQDRGWSDITRENDKVTFYWFGNKFSYNIPAIKDRKSAKIHVTLSSVTDRPLVTHMYFDELYYAKTNNNHWEDVPNRYASGSTVVINSENDNLILNNIYDLDQVVDGSLWPVIPPGKSEIEILQSSWAKKKPTVSIEFEERWL